MSTDTIARPSTFVSPDIARHFVAFARNGRWGTCCDCPRDTDGSAYPEFCKHTHRSDHHLTIKDLVNQHERYVARVLSGEIRHKR